MSRFLRTGTVGALFRRMKNLIPVSSFSSALLLVIVVTCPIMDGCLPAAAQWVDNAPADVPQWVEVGPLLPPTPPLEPEVVIVSGTPLLPGMLDGLDDEQLRYLRTTVFARHGMGFGDAHLTEYFEGRTAWTYKVREEYAESDLTLTDQQNLEVIMKAEGDWDAAGQQARVVVMQQTEDISKAAGSIEILDAYLTDKEAVANGTAPEGFEMPALDYYKEVGVKHPLTQVPPNDHGEVEPLEE